MAEFKQIVGALKVTNLRFMAGEHDASLDAGKAYQEFFGELHYSFDHKGIHFVVIDNVSDPGASIGQAQLAWLRSDLQRLDREQPIVVLTHRPLFPLYPSGTGRLRTAMQRSRCYRIIAAPRSFTDTSIRSTITSLGTLPITPHGR